MRQQFQAGPTNYALRQNAGGTWDVWAQWHEVVNRHGDQDVFEVREVGDFLTRAEAEAWANANKEPHASVW